MAIALVVAFVPHSRSGETSATSTQELLTQLKAKAISDFVGHRRWEVVREKVKKHPPLSDEDVGRLRAQYYRSFDVKGVPAKQIQEMVDQLLAADQEVAGKTELIKEVQVIDLKLVSPSMWRLELETRQMDEVVRADEHESKTLITRYIANGKGLVAEFVGLRENGVEEMSKRIVISDDLNANLLGWFAWHPQLWLAENAEAVESVSAEGDQVVFDFVNQLQALAQIDPETLQGEELRFSPQGAEWNWKQREGKVREFEVLSDGER